MSTWTKRCMRQADAVLIVARADQKPNMSQLEKELEHMSRGRGLKVLVLLHPEHKQLPTRTAEWLNLREWLTTHFHIKCEKQFLSKTKRKPKISRKQNSTENPHCDFARLARFITGTSSCLIFGGGGARGIAQLGILKTLLEKGVPIDMIGGVSIGALHGAIWAKYRDIKNMYNDVKYFSDGMSSYWNKMIELTYPVTSLFSGKNFGSQIADTLGHDIQIEDLWIPYFNITTDLHTSKIEWF